MRLPLRRSADLTARKYLDARSPPDAARIKDLVESELWDEQAQFFKVLPLGANASLRRSANCTV